MQLCILVTHKLYTYIHMYAIMHFFNIHKYIIHIYIYIYIYIHTYDIPGPSELTDLLEQVLSKRAADAAIRKLHKLLVCSRKREVRGLNESGVYVNFRHVVDDDCNLSSYTYIYIYVCMYVCMYVCIHVGRYVCMRLR